MVLVVCLQDEWVRRKKGRKGTGLGEGDAYWFCRQGGDDVIH